MLHGGWLCKTFRSALWQGDVLYVLHLLLMQGGLTHDTQPVTQSLMYKNMQWFLTLPHCSCLFFQLTLYDLPHACKKRHYKSTSGSRNGKYWDNICTQFLIISCICVINSFGCFQKKNYILSDCSPSVPINLASSLDVPYTLQFFQSSDPVGQYQYLYTN